MGWFYGFKLPIVVSDCGEWLALHLTPGNVDDQAPVPGLVHRVVGKLFGDKEPILQALFAPLCDDHQLQLMTRLRKHMASAVIGLTQKHLTRTRAILEAVNGQLK